MTASPLHRRRLLRSAAACLALPALARETFAAAPKVEIWKDPSCGCCQDWVTHLNKNRLATRVHDGGNAEARARLRIPAQLGSCHTAWIAAPASRHAGPVPRGELPGSGAAQRLAGGYAIEGHVPASAIHRLLKDKPAAIGLAVPGMPIGSPGMDGPAYVGRRDPYDVLRVLADGSTRVFQRER